MAANIYFIECTPGTLTIQLANQGGPGPAAVKTAAEIDAFFASQGVTGPLRTLLARANAAGFVAWDLLSVPGSKPWGGRLEFRFCVPKDASNFAFNSTEMYVDFETIGNDNVLSFNGADGTTYLEYVIAFRHSIGR